MPISREIQTGAHMAQTLKRPHYVPSLSAMGGTQNGFGVFVLPIIRMTLRYNAQSRACASFVDWIREKLPTYAKRYPGVEWIVAPTDSQRPSMEALFNVGTSRHIDMKDVDPDEQLQRLLDTTGLYERMRFRSRVVTALPAVRGLWQPFDGTGSVLAAVHRFTPKDKAHALSLVEPDALDKRAPHLTEEQRDTVVRQLQKPSRQRRPRTSAVEAIPYDLMQEHLWSKAKE